MPTACNLSLCLKYSGLCYREGPAVDLATRFETEFWSGVAKVPLVRVDEYLVGEWYPAVGRDWEDMTDPAGELFSGLGGRDSHWRLLAADGRVEGPA